MNFFIHYLALARKLFVTQASKVMFALYCIFLFFRIVHIGQIDQFSLHKIEADLIVGVVWLIFGLIFCYHKDLAVTKKNSVFQIAWKDVLFLLIIITLALSIIWRFGENTIDGDEIFQFETAAGYLYTGEFVQFDFKTEQPFIGSDGNSWEYRRAYGYTWVIAQSMRIFGISEWSARLPSVISFLLFVCGVYVVMCYWLNDRRLSIIIALAFIFSNVFIQMAGLVRMYSPFFLFFGLSVIVAYKAYIAYFHQKWRKSALYVGLFIPTFFISVHLHTISLIFIPTFFIFVCLEWFLQIYSRRQRSLQKNKQIFIVMSISVFCALLVVMLDRFYHFISWEKIHFGFRNPIYIVYAFADLPIYGFACATYIFGLCVMFRKSIAIRFLGVVSASMFFLFLYILQSNPTRRYFAIAYILIIPFIIVTARDLLYMIGIRDTKKIALLTLSLFMLCVPVSIPSVPAVSVFGSSVVDATESIDYPAAYTYIKERIHDGDVLLAVSFRNFYWGKDQETIALDLHRNHKEVLQNVDDMKKMLFQYHAGWIVWPKDNPRASTVVRAYVQSVSEHIAELDVTGLQVFYFNMEDKKSTDELRQYGEELALAAGLPSSLETGVLIQAQGNSKLFVLFKGEKHWIGSSSVFSSCRYVRSSVRIIQSSLLDEFPTGNVISSAADCIPIK